mmetsp:Transcript_118113/g.328390  ORF Transcript_118113/g.328390 Transcript_118113/m.328390 type:complete len:104 (-) Transcript_118113:423-734(-)
MTLASGGTTEWYSNAGSAGTAPKRGGCDIGGEDAAARAEEQLRARMSAICSDGSAGTPQEEDWRGPSVVATPAWGSTGASTDDTQCGTAGSDDVEAWSVSAAS